MFAASLIAAVIFLSDGFGVSGIRIVAKLVPVTALLIWLAPPKGRYGALIFAGLSLSLIGDAFLALPGDRLLQGLIAFLLAHLCYIAAFLGESRRLEILRLVPFALWVGAVYLFLVPNLGPMAVPVGVYSAVITLMMWRAAALVGMPVERWQVAALFGATLFGLSDSALALMRFHGNFPYGAAFLILAYWIGQFGIALSHQFGLAKSVPPV